MYTYQHNGKTYSEGAMCKFVSMDNGWGLKLYWSKATAEATYKLQKHAAFFGLAPAIGPHIFKFNSLGKYYYGYYTEQATHDVFDAYKAIYGEDWFDHKWPKDVRTNNLDFDSIGLPNLSNKLLDIGIKPEDLHCGNCAWLPNGTFVCIDFSNCCFVGITPNLVG